MGKSRTILVSGLLVVLIALHAFENIIDHEHWPFCAYRMYSWLEAEPALTSTRLVGVRPNGSEVPIQANAYMYPFDQARLADAFLIMDREPDARQREVVAMNDLLRRYLRRLRAGEHSGPDIVTLRLYRTTHHLEQWAANADVPDKRELLAESEKLQ